MKHVTITPLQKRSLGIATILALILGVYFMRTFVMLIVVAAIVAYIFNPLYLRLYRRSGKQGRSAALVLLLTFLAIILPMALVVGLTVIQVNHLLTNIGGRFNAADINSFGTSGIRAVNDFLASVHISYHLTTEQITQQASKYTASFSALALGILTSTIGGVLGFLTTLIIYVYVFLSLLRNQKSIISTVRSLNPLGEEIGDLYLRRIGAMTKAMVRGQFIIALAQGIIGAVLLYIAGLHGLFFFFLVILTVLSIIPLGAGIIILPIGIVMLFTGNIVGGLVVILGHILIITNIDNILRPRLVPEEARLDSALTMIGVFAGLAAFGFPGIVVGPVIMIVLVTTIQVYLDVNGTKKLDESALGSGDRPALGSRKRLLPRRKQKVIKPLGDKA
jgi:predicted PurR-regulated permease PerM